MDKISEEKRAYPRIKTSLKVNILKDICADSVDLSDGGLSFNSKEAISSPTVSLQIRFPDTGFELETNAKLIWGRDLVEGSSSYGVEFVNLNETQKSILREELIKTQIRTLLDAIKSSDVQQQISNFFLRDVLNNINKILKITSTISQQKDYSLELEKRLNHLNTQILLKGDCLEELLSDKKVMQKVKDNFRQLVGTWAYKSVIMKRAFDKPRGYPGDYKMLEIVYDNRPISKGLGMYFDNYFLKNPYAVAVRIRKDRLKELLHKFIDKRKLGRLHILNLACGSCREIREVLSALKTKSSVEFICIDWDEEALEFSEDMLSQGIPKNVEVKFVKEDIMNIIKSETIAQSYGKQDLIYSIGLIDYLPDRVLKKLIQALYQLLREGGELILTHKNREKTFPPLPPEWFCDWKFVSRNKEEVIKLFYACGISGFSLSVDSDDFEYIYYFTITKENKKLR